jgi:hypothetical protein
MATTGKPSSAAAREGTVAHTVQAKNPQQTEILLRNIQIYSRNGIGKGIAKRNQKTSLPDPKARSGGNAKKIIRGKRQLAIARETREIYAPAAATECYATTIVLPTFAQK